jgi:predicted enzyme related to lactoylglutathione lyase
LKQANYYLTQKFITMFSKTRAFSSFSVDNIERAKAFYGEVLGLRVEDSPMGLIVLHLESGNSIMAYPKPNHVPATFTILNFAVDSIETAVDQLAEKGVSFEQYDGQIKTDEKGICRNPEGPAIAWFKDPAGNILSVLEDTQNG